MNKSYCNSSKWQLLAYGLVSCSLAYAIPSDPVVISGSASFETSNAKTLLITTSDKAIINWRDFSIAENELAQFVQPSSKSVVVNRVTSELSSVLLGSLKANGRVFLINPSGILIGENASVDTNGFIASTLPTTSSALMDGTDDILFQGSSTASIVNMGTINAWDGDVFLIGYQIDNKGAISAPNGTAAIGAGQQVLLKPQALEKIVIRPSLAKYENDLTGIENSGAIAACKAELKADGNAYAMAIQHKGSIDALGIAEQNGEVFLVAESGNNGVWGSITASNIDQTGGSVQILGDHIALLDNANVNASGEMGGGTVLIGGDKNGKNPNILNAKTTFVDKNVKVTADAIQDGDGGKVIAWADETTCFYGNISTRGGYNSGDGGFVEVSGMHNLDFNGFADRLAPNGKAGTLLLDPLDINISNAADSNVTLVSPFAPTAVGANLNKTTLIAAVTAGNVIVQTAAGVGGTGKITVSPSSLSVDQISYNSAFDLTLDNTANSSPGSSITINKTNTTLFPYATIMNAGSGNLFIHAGNDININAAINMQGNVTITTVDGNFNMTGTNQDADIKANNVTCTINGNGTTTGQVNFTGGNTDNWETGIRANGTVIVTAAADITLQGGSNAVGSASTGAYIGSFNGPVTVSTPGNITLKTGTRGQANIASNNSTMSVTAGGNILIDSTLSIMSTSAAIFGGTSTTVSAVRLDEIIGFAIADVQAAGGPSAPLLINLTGDLTIKSLPAGVGRSGLLGGSVTVNTPGNLIMAGPTNPIATGGPIIQAQNSGIVLNVNNLTMDNTAGNTAQCVIVAYDGPIDITAQQTVTMKNYSTIFIPPVGGIAPEPLLVKAGTNMSIDTNSVVQNRTVGGSLILVVDNAPPFNVSPNIGPGTFSNLGQISTMGGPLQIFTALRSQDTIGGTLNGLTFVPGTLYVDTTTEHWLTYYPNAFGGTPYTIFYKDGITPPSPTPPPVVVQRAVTLFNTAAYEFLQSLENYDVFWYWETDFSAKYSPEFIRKYKKIHGLSSAGLLHKEIYHLLRKSYKEMNGKVVSLIR